MESNFELLDMSSEDSIMKEILPILEAVEGNLFLPPQTQPPFNKDSKLAKLDPKRKSSCATIKTETEDHYFDLKNQLPCNLESPDSSDYLSSDSCSTFKKDKKIQSMITACAHCHKNHIKCEGYVPCHQCNRRGIRCSSNAPQKRGPKPGHFEKIKSKITEQEATISKLVKELDQQRKISEKWQEKYKVLERECELLAKRLKLEESHHSKENNNQHLRNYFENINQNHLQNNQIQNQYKQNSQIDNKNQSNMSNQNIQNTNQSGIKNGSSKRKMTISTPNNPPDFVVRSSPVPDPYPSSPSSRYLGMVTTQTESFMNLVLAI